MFYNTCCIFIHRSNSIYCTVKIIVDVIYFRVCNSFATFIPYERLVGENPLRKRVCQQRVICVIHTLYHIVKLF